MRRPPFALALLAGLFVSGCVSDGSSASLEGIPEGSPPAGDGAGSPGAHGAEQRSEGGVTVQRSGDQWLAQQTVAFENDFGGASRADVTLSTEAGGVAARGWSNGGYRNVVLLRAYADDEQTARQWLERIVVRHDDGLSGGTLVLSTEVDLPDNPPRGVSLSGGITANLPREPSYTLDIEVAAGGATTTGLNGASIDVDVAAGGASIDGAFGRMTVDAAAGGVELVGTANDVTVEAAAGGVQAQLRAGGSGTWTFDVAAGGLAVEIERTSGDGFDVRGTVTAGGASVSLSDGETLSEGGGYTGGSRHVRSRGFDSAAIQVTVDARVAAGGMSIRD